MSARAMVAADAAIGAGATPGAGDALAWDLRVAGERLALVAASVDWDLPAVEGRPLAGEALSAWCVAHSERVSQAAAELGLGLWLRKRELGHGAYMGWLRDQGIPQQRAAEAIGLARLIFGAPAESVPALTALPRPALLALAPGGASLVEALHQDGTLADLASMSRDDIRALVRERMETAALRERLSATARERDEARSLLDAQRALPEATRRLRGLRLEAIREAEHLRSNALGLERIVAALERIGESGQATAEYGAACQAVVYALQGLQSLVDRALNQVWGLQAHYTPEQRMPPPLMDEADAQRAREWAAQYLAEADVRTAGLRPLVDADAGGAEGGKRGAKRRGGRR